MPPALGPQGAGSPLSVSSGRPQNETATSKDASFEQLSAAYAPRSSRSTESVPPPADVDESTLWLARAIYSETKLLHEQELVAWVVRNRVETRYRGKSTYREVVLDPYQFSAFNPGSPKRSLLTRLQPETPLPEWQEALWVAHYVRHAEPIYRPFPIQTRHFYSERSMDGRRMPYWADGSRFVPSEERRYLLDEQRFRFYKQIS